MANKINFITGETYTLAELFSGERRIIIPDLQRDYCWGDENNVKSIGETGELVSGFIKNLIEQYKEQKEKDDQGTLNLGMFYGYEVPANHIQLCDGQQRLTTLYLLLGMLNKKTGEIRHHLISDYQFKQDDKEPYLNYAIRESSLYFLRDLVSQFFIENQDTVETIKKADWYFEDYNLDPSINSMLKALQTIENLSNEMPEDLGRFEDWLLNKVTFLYFDMETRKNGEETFVVINTTGEALSATQNLKPLVLQEKNNIFDNTTFFNSDNLPIAECWEEIETWFWKKRNDNINGTSDAGFAEFLRWISIIELVNEPVPSDKKTKDITKLHQLLLQGKECDFPYRKIPFEKIYSYWKSLIWITTESRLSFSKDDSEDYLSPFVNKDVNNRRAIGQNECFVLLPVLKYIFQNIEDIGSDVAKQLNAKRIYHFFKNIMKIQNASKNVNQLVGDAINIIDLIKNGDIATLVDSSVDASKISIQILSKEEKTKFEILLESPNRSDIEEAFWELQDHPIWSGEILTMVEWAFDENRVFNFVKFNEYRKKFLEVFIGNCDANIDFFRRALLTLNLKNYPLQKGSNYSFGWYCEDWHIIINNNKAQFKNFFDSFTLGHSNQAMSNLIKNCQISNVWIGFITEPMIMAYCEQKNIQLWNNSYRLIKGVRATTYVELKAYSLFCEYPDNYLGWEKGFYDKENTCLWFKKRINNKEIAIEVYFNRKKENDYSIDLFLKEKEAEEVQKALGKPAQSILGISSVNSDSGRFVLGNLSKEDVKQKVEELLSYEYNMEVTHETIPTTI